jgi:hypothetical protein
VSKWTTKTPCPQCPYRLDAPRGVWSAETYQKLLTLGKGVDTRLFACHATRDTPENTDMCAGWLLSQHEQGVPALGLRLAIVSNPAASALMGEITARDQPPVYTDDETLVRDNMTIIDAMEMDPDIVCEGAYNPGDKGKLKTTCPECTRVVPSDDDGLAKHIGDADHEWMMVER